MFCICVKFFNILFLSLLLSGGFLYFCKLWSITENSYAALELSLVQSLISLGTVILTYGYIYILYIKHSTCYIKKNALYIVFIKYSVTFEHILCSADQTESNNSCFGCLFSVDITSFTSFLSILQKPISEDLGLRPQ